LSILAMLRRHRPSTRFPYTTLFRSVPAWDGLTYRHLDPQHPEWKITPYHDGLDPSRYLADRYHDLIEHGARRLVEAIGLIADERSEEHTSELQSRENLVCRLLLEKK